MVFAFLFGIGSSSESNPKFTLTKDRLLGEVPSVSIEFPDGSTDTLVLRKYYSNNQDRMAEVERCNFIGHLAVVSIDQKYSRLRCLLPVKGLVICFYLGRSGSTNYSVQTKYNI